MFVLWIIGAMLAFLAVYGVVHYVFPSWGTVVANALAAVGALLEYANELPWSMVLSADKAALILFSLAAANGIIRAFGKKNPVGSGA